MSDAIKGFFGKYRFLSNFYADMNPIKVDMGKQSGIVYFPTSEHMYQASKFRDNEPILEIANAHTPGKAKFLGGPNGLSSKDWKRIPSWDDIKTHFMWDALKRKFDINVNPDLCQALADTGDKQLFELNTWDDTVWGVVEDVNGDLVGENWLGKQLMTLRDNFFAHLKQ